MCRKKIAYFCDESNHKDGEFMAVGGIALNVQTLGSIEAAIVHIRNRMNITREIKWSNVRDRRDNPHKAYADLLKTLVDAGNLHFHIRFQRTQDWDHRFSGPRKKVDTVSKGFYQLLLHRPIRYYGGQCDLYVTPDKGNCTKELPNYRGHLNSDCSKRFHTGVKCVKDISPICSKESHPLQLLDVTLGALTALRNNRTWENPAKEELAHYIHDLWGNPPLGTSTLKSERKFNVWNASPSRVAPMR